MCLQVVCQIKDPVVDPRLAVTYSDEALAKNTREEGGEKVLAVDAVFLLPVLWETNSYDPEFKMVVVPSLKHHVLLHPRTLNSKMVLVEL